MDNGILISIDEYIVLTVEISSTDLKDRVLDYIIKHASDYASVSTRMLLKSGIVYQYIFDELPVESADDDIRKILQAVINNDLYEAASEIVISGVR